MGRTSRFWTFVIHALFGLFFIHSGMTALRTGDASGMYINDRPVETREEMRSFVYWGTYGVVRGAMYLVVPIDECSASSEDDDEWDGDPATTLRSRPLSLTLLRVCFFVVRPRGFECEPDEPWANLWA